MKKFALNTLREWLIVIFGCAQTSSPSLEDWMHGQP